MKRILRILALLYTSIATAMLGQGTTGGLLYASDFAKWSLPRGNTPAQGTIFYPNPDICKVTSNGYTFVAAKVGRPITILDGTQTETFTPTSVIVNNNVCMISGPMTFSHSSYSLVSASAGAQEAIDYQAATHGVSIVLTPAWVAAGGNTGMIAGLNGSANVTILDQRTAVLTPYVWNGTNFVAQPFSQGGVQNGTQYQMPAYATATQVGPSNVVVDSTLNNLLVPGTVAVGGGSPGCGSALGCFSMNENNSGGTPTPGVDYCRADSVSHGFKCSFNGAGEASFTTGSGTVAGGTSGYLAQYTGATTVGTTSPIDYGITTPSTLTSTAPLITPGINNLTNAGTYVTAASGNVTTGLNNWIAAQIASGNRGVLWIDPTVGSGSPTSTLTSLTRVLDARGLNCMDQFGAFFYADLSTCAYAREDRQDSTSVTTNSALWDFGYHSAKGGVYTSTSDGHGVKSNRSVANMFGAFRTNAQNWGLYTQFEGFAGGELDPFSTIVEEYGGFLGYGQESPTMARYQVFSGQANDGVGGVFQGTITGIAGSTVTFSTSDANARTLGESRFIRDLSNSYSTGTISNVVCSGSPQTCTVTGSGTTWTSITGFVGTHTTWTGTGLSFGGPIATSNLTLCFTPNANNGHDWCVPITAGTNDTTLTVNLYNLASTQNTPWWGPTSGAYVIYHCAWPTSVNAVSGAWSFTSGDNTGLTNGHTIDQVMAYNQNFLGELILESRDIGSPSTGGGINIVNYSPSTSPAFSYGVDVEGNYQAAIRTDSYSGGPPQNFAFLNQRGNGAIFADFSPATTTAWTFYEFFDSNGTIRQPISFNPNAASGTFGMCWFGSWCFSPSGAFIGNYSFSSAVTVGTVIGTASSAVNIQGGSSSANDLVVKNAAGTVNNALFADNGNETLVGGLTAAGATMSASISMGNNPVVLNGQWWVYNNGSSFFVRDNTNSKSAIAITSNTQATVFYGPIQSAQGVAQTAGNIALSAGWGSTAAVSAVSGQGNRFRFTITSSGTGQAANPTITSTLPTAFAVAPLCNAQQTGGTGGIVVIKSGTETTTSTGAMTWVGTPVAASTYIIDVTCF